MSRYTFSIKNSDSVLVKLSDIINLIPNNQLHWSILELTGSGNLTISSKIDSMSALIKLIDKNRYGFSMQFDELQVIANSLENLDECFIVGTTKKNTRNIVEILNNRKQYDYIIDYFDSSTLEIESSNLTFIESLYSIYNQ